MGDGKPLTERQQQYIWLAGSHPDKIVVQGRGYRTRQLGYGLDGDELVLFGYSTPLLWLERRGLFRKLANANAYVLTDAGEQAYRTLLVRGAGLRINPTLRKTTVKPRETP